MGAMRNGQARLTKPLVRDDGELREASWDEALERAAAVLGAATRKYARNGAGLVSCAQAWNEMNFIHHKFVHQALASNNIDSCNRT